MKRRIDDALNDLPQVTIPGIYWGVCDLAYSEEYGKRFNRGITVVIPFYRRMTLDDYSESEFALLEMTTYRYRLEVGNAMSKLFTELGIDFDIPVVLKNHDQVYKAFISVKDMAVRSGLGWIGKNDLLITPEHGPRVSLVAVLVNTDLLEPGVPVVESRCGECDLCVSACPFGNIHGKEWSPGRPREERVDYVRCSDCRMKAKPKIGRKLACGKCICSCPYGAKRSANGGNDDVQRVV